MTMEENESVVVYDYAQNTVGVYTTRYGVRNQLMNRVGEENFISYREIEHNGKAVAWDIKLSMDHCRGPEYISKIVSK